MATPNILALYQAAHPMVLTQWWVTDLGRSDFWKREQDQVGISLNEWALLDKAERIKHQNANCTISIVLSKTWEDVKEVVAPDW